MHHVVNKRFNTYDISGNHKAMVCKLLNYKMAEMFFCNKCIKHWKNRIEFYKSLHLSLYLSW